MAIIPCPECGKEISSAAFSCPYCGYPIAGIQEGGYVRIKIPDMIAGAPSYPFRKTKVTVRREDQVLWTGFLGEVARFRVNGPTRIIVDMGNHARQLRATVEPFGEYRMAYLHSRWWNLPEYALVPL